MAASLVGQFLHHRLFARVSSNICSPPVVAPWGVPVPGFRRSLYRFRSSSSSSMASSEHKESSSNNPGLHPEPDEATKGYFLQQTMLRVKDPKVSLDFYSRVLGMTLLKRLDFPEMKFSLYFLGYENTASAPSDPSERTVWTFAQRATLELTHNWGTETDPEFKGYHSGNSEPRGFGHIGITVDDTYKACERFEHLGVEFVKRPDDVMPRCLAMGSRYLLDWRLLHSHLWSARILRMQSGKMKGLAFIKDPDGYWIEIFDLKKIGDITAAAS